MRRRDFRWFIGRFRRADRMGARAGDAAPDCDCHSRRSSCPHRRFRNSLFIRLFGGAASVGRCRGTNLTVDRYSAEGRPERYADLAREIVNRNPQVIVASTDPIALAARAAGETIPIVWIGGDAIRAGLAASLAHPGGNVTGVSVYAGVEIWGKRLQILKEAVPSASKVAFLEMRTDSAANEQQLREVGRQLGISVIDMPLQDLTPSEYRRVFSQIAQERPEAIIVSSDGALIPYRQLIVELVEKTHLPAMYGHHDFVEGGGLMAYESDLRELGGRFANDVHQILNGAKPADIPIYQPTKFQFSINLRAAKAVGLTLPPALLAGADEVIE